MAESDNEKDPRKPPKLSIGKPESTDGSPPSEDSRPRQDSTTEEDLLYGETTRINLHEVAPGATPGDEGEAATGESTTRINLPEQALKQPGGESPTAKKDTSRIDVSDARPPSPELVASEQQKKKAKKDTSRVDAAAARPVEGESPHDTVPMKPAVERRSPHDTDRMAPTAEAAPHDTDRMQPGAPGETARIDLAKTTPPPDSGVKDLSDEERERMMKARTLPMEALEPPAAKKKTARVVVEDEDDASSIQDHETARITPVTSRAADTRIPSETAKVTLDRELSPDDVFAPVGLSSPKTEAKDEDVEEAAAAPEAEIAEAEGGRSKTARIDLPPDALSPKSGRPKTIRIKRADAEPAGKPATKPPSKQHGKVRGIRKGAAKAPKAKVDSPPGEVGALSAVLTLGAIVVSLALLYVLAAQTVLPNLSWFGKVAF